MALGLRRSCRGLAFGLLCQGCRQDGVVNRGHFLIPTPVIPSDDITHSGMSSEVSSGWTIPETLTREGGRHDSVSIGGSYAPRGSCGHGDDDTVGPGQLCDTADLRGPPLCCKRGPSCRFAGDGPRNGGAGSDSPNDT